VLAKGGEDVISEESKRAIDAANKKFSEGFLKGDASTTALSYSQDSVVFPPDADFVQGKRAIEEFWRSVMQSGVEEANLTTLDLIGNDDFIHERGTGILKVHSKNGKISEQKIKYVVVWKRVANEWKNLWDIWNGVP
jgi:ketosteroid isomerase-like protein